MQLLLAGFLRLQKLCCTDSFIDVNLGVLLGGGELPRYCWHRGCILPRVPAVIVQTGPRAGDIIIVSQRHLPSTFWANKARLANRKSVTIADERVHCALQHGQHDLCGTRRHNADEDFWNGLRDSSE